MKLPGIISTLLLILCCTKVANALQIPPTNEKSANRPNIIFILTDDQRFDALGFAGNTLIHTPEMDELAKMGTYFSNAMVTTPICAASRASILTGIYERTHRYDFGTDNIREVYMNESYPAILKKNGYYTGFYGKYGVRFSGLEQQFDVYESYDRNGAYEDKRGYFYKTLKKDTVHLTRYTGQKAIDFINEVGSKEPFCLSLSFSAPHAHDNAESQYFWQKESDKLLQGINVPPPKLGEDRYFNEQPKMVRNGFNRLRWKWRYDTPAKYQHSVKGYYRMISGIDREIGKIRKQLRKKDLDKNTVIILMGDNGYFLGERQLAGKWLLYDNSVRVPLIIYDPRQKRPQQSDELTLNIDVPSTILALAGLQEPDSWQGKSLLPIISGSSPNLERDTVLIEHIWEFENIPPSEGVRTREWKYFRYVNDKSLEALYHLKDDPGETNNLALRPEYLNKLRKFRKTCDQLIDSYSDAYSEGPADASVAFKNRPKTTGVSRLKPLYQWDIPKLVVSQTAYQVLVSSSEKNSNNNIGDIWNSGRVASGESSKIAHKGIVPERGETYFLKVRIWDEHKRLSRYSKSFSFKIPD